MLDRCTKRGTTCTLLSLNGGTSRLIREPHRAKRDAATVKRFSNGGTPLSRCCSPPGLWIQRRTYIGRQTGRPTPRRPRVNTPGRPCGRQTGRPPPNDPGRNPPGRSYIIPVHRTGCTPNGLGPPSRTKQKSARAQNNGAPETRNPLPFAFELWKSKEASPCETQRKTFGRTRRLSEKEEPENNTGE